MYREKCSTCAFLHNGSISGLRRKCSDTHDLYKEKSVIMYNDLWSKKNPYVRTHESIAIKKVIFANPATIVFWTDGDKTVVKVQNNEQYDPEKGLAMAICKRIYGNTGNYYNNFKKWLPNEKGG